MAESQAELQNLSQEFNKLQQELEGAVQSRQRLEAQKRENVSVQQEFDQLKEGEIIYKVMGPALVKQDKVEAESTVKGRLDFIDNEITRSEGVISDIQQKMEGLKGKIIALQSGAAQSAGPKGKGKAAASAASSSPSA